MSEIPTYQSVQKHIDELKSENMIRREGGAKVQKAANGLSHYQNRIELSQNITSLTAPNT